ncbi:hypothetical protein Nepgr_019820 [Nepenthes gracilis]|uniref:Uncharacterized protein n=1 Tax=Nepenthes gracilis TaxID=150966 RepID=A0AAD3SVV5_NEPGR|nr:hypothetical protein Nepgr_019820 [Nepenthes gracilis]
MKKQQLMREESKLIGRFCFCSGMLSENASSIHFENDLMFFTTTTTTATTPVRPTQSGNGRFEFEKYGNKIHGISRFVELRQMC